MFLLVYFTYAMVDHWNRGIVRFYRPPLIMYKLWRTKRNRSLIHKKVMINELWNLIIVSSYFSKCGDFDNSKKILTFALHKTQCYECSLEICLLNWIIICLRVKKLQNVVDLVVFQVCTVSEKQNRIWPKPKTNGPTNRLSINIYLCSGKNRNHDGGSFNSYNTMWKPKSFLVISSAHIG